MKNMSIKVGLLKKYTNHDIRVTGCSILARCQFSDKQIMAISGHKSVESLKIYKKVSADEKFKMGFMLGYVLKTGDVPALTEKCELVELPALPPPESKPKKKKIVTAASVSTPNKENEGRNVAQPQPGPSSS